ncbi:MAG: hypothetical protein HZB39_02140 [Planctomycetes bacterium]|nr:hypothetical protein [Planctomycetota bacterium]
MLRVIVRTVAALVIVELVLQGVAYLAWRRIWIGPDGGVDPNTVLMVGDATVAEDGVATQEEAWPAEVQALLRAQHPSLRVVAGAAPGRDSQAVLVRLQEQLDAERPRFVYVRVGREDLRRGEASIVRDDELRGRAGPFRVECRTWGIVRDAIRAVAGAAGTDPTGIWHAGAVIVEFGEEGRFRLGPATGTWRTVGIGAEITLPGAPVAVVTITRTARGIDLTGEFPGGHLSLEPGAPAGDVVAAAEASLARGEYAEARWMLATAAEGAPADHGAIASLAALDLREGRRDDAERRVAMLREAAADELRALAPLARALLALGQCREAVDVASRAPAEAWSDPVFANAMRAMPDAEQRARRAERLAAAPAPPVVTDAERMRRRAVLRANLVRLVELCRFHGAEPILLEPEEEPDATGACEDCASVTGATILRGTARRSALRALVHADLTKRLGG